ncbi:hypothetical protein V2J09_014378 [Rumex salicifolius]
MECRDRRKNSPSGNEGFVCNKCGWQFPNPHPSARHRRAHKKVCGTIEVKHGKNGDHKTNMNAAADDDDLSDNDSKTLINGSETMEKIEEMAVSSRSISGFGSGSNRSNRSEEDVFSDAITDFLDNSSGVSDSDDVKDSAKMQDFYEDELVLQRAEDNGFTGGSDPHSAPSNHLSSSTLDSSPTFGLSIREEVSSIIGLEEKGSAKLVQDKKSDDIGSIPTENVALTFDSVVADFDPQKVNGDMFELLTADSAVEVMQKRSDLHSLENLSQAVEDTNQNAGNVHEMVVPEPVQELEYVTEPSEKTPDKKSTGVFSEALSQEDNFDEEYSVEREMEKAASHSTGVQDMKEVSQGKAATEFKDGDEYDGRSTMVAKLSESTPSVPEFEDWVDNKGEAERNNSYEKELEDAAASESASYVQIKMLRNSEATHELMVVGESSSSVVTNSISSVDDEVNAHNLTNKASDFVDDSLTEEVNGNGAQLEKTEISNVEELENACDKVLGDECFGKVDIGLISDNDDTSDLTQNAANTFNAGSHMLISYNDDISDLTQNAANTFIAGSHMEVASAFEDQCIKERNGTASASTDLQADSFSQTDSLECNWGSISVLSTLSDAPAATETGSQLSQESSNKAEKAILQSKPNTGKSVEKEEKADENWSTRKSLKSYLGESSHSAKDNLPPMKTINMVMSTKEQADESATAAKEWNSPARYPSNIKTEKVKVRRPYWAPFICCSSVQTS